MNIFGLVIGAICLLILPGSAQDADAQVGKKKRRGYRVTTVDGKWRGGDLYVARKKGGREGTRRRYAKLDITDMSLSVEYRFVSRNQIVLYEKVQNDEGANVYREVTKLKVPSEIKKPLVILVFDEKNSKIQGLPVDLDASVYPPGSYRFLNAATKPVVLELGQEDPIVVPPYEEKIFSRGIEHKRLIDFRGAFLDENGRPDMTNAFDRELIHRENKRMTFVMYGRVMRTGNTKLLWRVLVDFVNP